MRKTATKGRMQANDAAAAHRAGMARGQGVDGSKLIPGTNIAGTQRPLPKPGAGMGGKPMFPIE